MRNAEFFSITGAALLLAASVYVATHTAQIQICATPQSAPPPATIPSPALVKAMNAPLLATSELPASFDERWPRG